MTAAAPARPHYFEGQTVDAALLGCGQDWLDAGIARHRRDSHRWGVICGLALAIAADGDLTLEPGAACDANGDSLCVAAALRLSLPESAAGALDLWLRRVEATPAPGRRRPGALPFAFAADADTAVDPDRPLDPDGATAVYLGRLGRDGAGWQPLAVRRRLIGITAGRLAAPGGTATLTLGAADGTGAHTLAIAGGAGRPPVMSIDGAGTPTLDGTLAAPALVLGGAGLALAEPPPDPPDAPPPQARPGTLRTAPGVLILEPPAGGRLVVGSGDGAAFRPILSVAASGDVEIQGSLAAGGEIRQAPVPADAADPRFVQTLVDAVKAIPPLDPAPTPGASGGGP